MSHLDAAFQTPRRPASRPRPERTAESTAPWTAARCHRLLRPLVSRIASLRRDTPTNDPLLSTTSSSISSASTLAASSRTSGIAPDPSKTPDSEWLAPKKKRPRLTYSQRRTPPRPELEKTVEASPPDGKAKPGGCKKTLKSLQQQERHQRSTAPGELVASTPLLRRARGYVLPSPGPKVPMDATADTTAEPYRSSKDGRAVRGKRISGAHKDLEERLLRLRAHLSYERYSDLEAIYRSLEALLKATAPPESPARGPRSFLDMCLRKVPQYIVAHDAYERQEAEDSGTVTMLDEINTSAQIYSELEDLGPTQGWKHLRVIVRADGINAVKEGITECLFEDNFLQLLVDLCVQSGATPEAEDLMAAITERHCPQPSSADSYLAQVRSLYVLSTLSSYTNKTGRSSFQLRQLSYLLPSSFLPQDWLATPEFARVWGLAAKGLSGVKASHDSVVFMIRAILLLCTRKQTLSAHTDNMQLQQDMCTANQRTLTSALAILASMSLLNENEIQSSSHEIRDVIPLFVIGNRIRYILRACIAELESRRGRRNRSRIDLLYLALFLSSKTKQGKQVEARLSSSLISKEAKVYTSSTKQCVHTHYDSVSWLVSSIARSCGRGASVMSHQCLDTLFQRLEILGLRCDIVESLKGVSAFLLAQQTSNVRDLIYAESLDMRSKSEPGKGPDRETISLFTGYRWDETIGEWVTASPVSRSRQSKKRPRPRSYTMDSNREQDAERKPVGPMSLVSLETNGVPDAETNQASSARKVDKARQIGLDRTKSSRKRSAHGGIFTTTTTGTAASLKPKKSVLAPKVSRLFDDELDEGKENRDRMSVCKPHITPRRAVLGTRPRSSLSNHSGRGSCNVLSDDELCT
ncbi:hypothetical protein F5Y15DRAFT_143726 [Xylariaceae sp. FL0016]|nr:hypothetical protein F5Y15DRAFT_143726 [Xylariaceae sp. FL0016]